jgi:hypothetical protein
MTADFPPTIGELLDRAITIVLRNAVPILLLAAMGAVPQFLLSIPDAPMRPGGTFSANAVAAALGKLLAAFVTWIVLGIGAPMATALFVDARVRREPMGLFPACRAASRRIVAGLFIFLRYLVPLAVVAVIWGASLTGVTSGKPQWILLGTIGLIVALVPYAQLGLAVDVAMVQCVLRWTDTSGKPFRGGIAALDFTSRNLLAALTVFAVGSVPYVAGVAAERVWHFPTIGVPMIAPVLGVGSGAITMTFAVLYARDMWKRDVAYGLANSALLEADAAVARAGETVSGGGP